MYRPFSQWQLSLGVPPASPEQLGEFAFEWPPPRYNIAPTNDIVCVYVDAEVPQVRVPILQRWGLVPFWADDLSIGNRMINARSETISEKPSFRNLFKRRRCLIPADGYYEWQKVPGGKQPQYIHDPNGVIAMAGLWDENTKVSGDGSGIRTCTIITTAANRLTSPIHDRMPVIIEPENQEEWLDPANENVDQLKWLCKPAGEDRLSVRAVSQSVGNVRHQGAELIEPIDQ